MVNLTKALLKVQQEIGAIAKDSKNPFFKSSYLSLNGVREAVIPVLSKYGVVLLQPTRVVDGKTFVSTTLIHADSGELLESMTEVVTAKAGDAQSFGSGLSYSRRYGLMSMLCLSAEDDDGNSAVGKTSTATKMTAPAAAPSLEARALNAMGSTSAPDVTPVSTAKAKPSFSKKAIATPAAGTGDTL